MEKLLKKFFSPLHVYVEKFINLQLSNIRKAQDKQKKDLDRHHLSNSEMKVGDLILLSNNKRKDRKGGKFSFAWLGPYIVSEITPKLVATLKK